MIFLELLIYSPLLSVLSKYFISDIVKSVHYELRFIPPSLFLMVIFSNIILLEDPNCRTPFFILLIIY